jgi:hypothetical protein
MANAKTEQIILRILRTANSENPPLMGSSALPPSYSGTLPPPRNPNGQPVRSEKQRAGGLGGVKGSDVHRLKGAGLRWFRSWRRFEGKEGERVKGSFQSIKPRGSRLYNQL